MAKIFISYRRQDSSHSVGRLYDRLQREFGRDVFMDIESIRPGENFGETIESRIKECDAFLVCIGPQWAAAADESGFRRIDSREDWVRREIEIALRQNVPVVPILLNDTAMPSQVDLPASLQGLTRINSLPLRHEAFHRDLNRLIDLLKMRDGNSALQRPDRSPGDLQDDPRLSDRDAAECIVSYATRDSDVAGHLSEMFRRLGYHPTMLSSEDKVEPEQIARVLRKGGRVIILLSAAYAENFQRSGSLARTVLTQDPLNGERYLVLFRIDSSKPPGLLASFVFTDLVPLLGNRSNSRELEEVIRGTLQDFSNSRESSYAALFRPTDHTILHADIYAVPRFIGRQRELDQLLQALSRQGTGHDAPACVAWVSGPGGVGKSALAREYAWQNRDKYEGVWWIRAMEPQTAINDLVELARRIYPHATENLRPRESVRFALRALERPSLKPWLLVYDDVVSSDDLRELLPRWNTHVVITSRAVHDTLREPMILLEKLRHDEAVDFLLSRISQRSPTPRDINNASRLAEELDGLPLALNLAQALVAQNGDDYSHLLAGLQGQDATGVRGALEGTVELAARTIASRSLLATEFLEVCAFLAPEHIPIDLVREEVVPATDREQALSLLSTLRLMTLETLPDETAGVGMHQLLQELVRNRLQRTGGYAEALESASQLVADSLPFESDDPSYRDSCTRLIPHALSIASLAGKGPYALPSVVRLLNQTGLYLMSQASAHEAQQLFQFAETMARALYDERHPAVAVAMSNLARAHHEMGDLSNAEALTRRTLWIQKQTLAPSDGRLAVTLNNLAGVLADMRQFEEAEALLREALSSIPDPANLQAGVLFNNLANVLQEQNKLDEALAAMTRALLITEGRMAADSSAIATRLHNLALLYQATGRPADAQLLMERALSVTEARFGHDHPSIASRLRNLAWLHQDAGRNDAAESAMRRALAITANYQTRVVGEKAIELNVDESIRRPSNVGPADYVSPNVPRATGRIATPASITNDGALEATMKAALLDADFKSDVSVRTRSRTDASNYWADIEHEYGRFKAGVGLREKRRPGGYSETDVLEYLSTLEMADPDDVYDFCYHISEVYGLYDLAAASVLARSESHLDQDRTTIATLLALVAMEASIRAENKGFLRRSTEVLGRSLPNATSSEVIARLQSLWME